MVSLTWKYMSTLWAYKTLNPPMHQWLGVCETTRPLCHSVQWRLMAHWLCPVLGSSRPVMYSISGGKETWWAFGRLHWYCYYLNLTFDFRCPTRPRNSKILLVHPLGTWHGHLRFGPICACVESNIWLKSSAKLAQIATSPQAILNGSRIEVLWGLPPLSLVDMLHATVGGSSS
jgi:hypothetical protein